MKTVLIINEKKCSAAPRLKQTYSALRFDYNIILAGDEKPDYISSENFINLTEIENSYYAESSIIKRLFRKLRRVMIFLTLINKSKWKKELLHRLHHGARFKQLEILSKLNVHIIINHHLYSLPLAVKLADKNSCKVIVNTHEYYPDHMNPSHGKAGYYNERMNYICSTYLPKIDHIFAVSNGIGNRYKLESGIEYSLVRNDKPYEEIPVKRTSKDVIKLVHHGTAHPLRNIDLMIKMMSSLPDIFELHLMLVGSKEYIDELKKIAETNRVFFHPPVLLDQIPKKLNEFDLALFIFKPITFNLANVLPNKFFEAIQGRLGIVTGPSPDITSIVSKFNLGVIFDSFKIDDIVAQISKITPMNVDVFKENCQAQAKELSSEKTASIIRNVIKQLVQK